MEKELDHDVHHMKWTLVLDVRDGRWVRLLKSTRESRTRKDSKKRVRLESESEKSPSPRKVRVRNEDSKNESNLSPYPHQRHMYDTSLESSRPPDGRGVIEICIPPLATPPEAKTLFWLLWCYKCTTLTKMGSFIHPVSNPCSYSMKQMYHSRGTFENSREHLWTQGNSRKLKGTHGNSTEHLETQGKSWEPMGT